MLGFLDVDVDSLGEKTLGGSRFRLLAVELESLMLGREIEGRKSSIAA